MKEKLKFQDFADIYKTLKEDEKKRGYKYTPEVYEVMAKDIWNKKDKKLKQ